MIYEDKKEKLREYIATIGRLERKCEESARWDSLAEGSEPDSSNGTKITAIQIRAECEKLAAQANALRQRLVRALEQMPTEKRREVLELYYLSGLTTSQICLEKRWSKRYVLRIHSEAIQELTHMGVFF